MTDQCRKEQLELRLAQSIRLLKQVDDPTTRERLHELTEALEKEKERQNTHEKAAPKETT
jgi:hypothetical protein